MVKIDFVSYKYREVEIMYNLYGDNEYTVQYCGDDYYFDSIKDAEKFIDDEIMSIPFC